MEKQEIYSTDLYKLKNQIKQAGLLFCYSGPISQGIIEEVGDTIKSRIIVESSNTTLALKIFSIFIEQSQNIVKYSSDSEMDDAAEKNRLKDSIIILGRKEGKYFIGFGNLIENTRKDQLKELLKQRDEIKLKNQELDNIRKMDKTALKIYYKEQMRRNIDLDSTSMGMGLIEIARNASEPLEYDIRKVNREYSFFSLQVSVFLRS